MQDFKEQLSEIIIPALEAMLEREKIIFTFLQNSEHKNEHRIAVLIEYSALSMDHLNDRIEEYKEYCRQ